jgi:hypothetical protein
MFDELWKPDSKRFQEKEVINHAFPSALCDDDKTA